MMNLKIYAKINGVTHEVDNGLIAFDPEGVFYNVENLIMNLNVRQVAAATVDINGKLFHDVGIDLASKV